MIPFTVARVIASRHAANYRRGDEPRAASTPAHVGRLVEFCRIVDRNRAELAELARLSPVARRLWSTVVEHAAGELYGLRPVPALVAAAYEINHRPEVIQLP